MDALVELARQGALLEGLEQQTALLQEVLRDLEQRSLKRSEVPLSVLLDLWAGAPSTGTYRERARLVAAALVERGYGQLPGAKAEVIERRMRRRRQGAGGQC